MEQVRERTFKGGDMVETDGTHFIKCHFDASSCAMRRRTPGLRNCTFTRSAGISTARPWRTIQLLQANGNSEGGRPFNRRPRPGRAYYESTAPDGAAPCNGRESFAFCAPLG